MQEFGKGPAAAEKSDSWWGEVLLKRLISYFKGSVNAPFKGNAENFNSELKSAHLTGNYRDVNR
jgi:hypothetical protein